MSITKKKILVDKNGHEYMLFRIDVYFTECILAVEIDEKNHRSRNLIFEEKRQEALEKKTCQIVNLLELIRASVMMKVMKLVELKHLLVNLKTEN